MHSKFSTTSSVSLDSQRTVCGLLYSINNLYVLQAELEELEQRQASVDLQQQQQAQQQAEEEKEEQEEQQQQQQAQQRLTQEGSGLEAQACRGEGSLDLAAPRAGE